MGTQTFKLHILDRHHLGIRDKTHNHRRQKHTS